MPPGIPLQTIVGAETGVGLVDDWRHGVNFPILAKTFTGWVFTIILAALFSAALFAMGTYSPSVHMAHDIQVSVVQLGSAPSIYHLAAINLLSRVQEAIYQPALSARQCVHILMSGC